MFYLVDYFFPRPAPVDEIGDRRADGFNEVIFFDFTCRSKVTALRAR